MQPRKPLPLDSAFGTAEALCQGVSRRRLRAADLVAPFHSVRTTSAPADAADFARAAARRLSDGQVLTGAAAAALWGLPLPHRVPPPSVVQVAVPKGRTRATGRGIQSREIRPDLFTWCDLDGVAVTDPVLTWCVLARYSTVSECVRLGDALVSNNVRYVGRHPNFDPFSIEALADAVKRWKGCVGIDVLRAAQPWVRERVASPPESDLRMFAMDAGLPEFEVNQAIHDPAGKLVAVVDGLIRDVGLVLEYDGDGHRTDKRQWRRDVRRSGDLDTLGYIRCHATGEDLYGNRDAFEARLRRSYERALDRSWPVSS